MQLCVYACQPQGYYDRSLNYVTSCFVIIGNYNDYLRISGGVVGNVACNRVVKSTDVHCISKDTLLIHLVSLENVNKNDWLYIVLMDVVSWLIVALLLIDITVNVFL